MNAHLFVRFVSLPGSDVRELAIPVGGTVADVLEIAGFPIDEGIVTVNATEVDYDHVVNDNDRVILTKKEVKNG